ncbi:hypothetical protein PtA15_15A155 [Puccinia triticina]|uniref:Uncharacterized protein n=1 Tax=Puccinia triticina TaxID=208348 RepID=A0ABY7D2C4_9BASI|nr:uncharacterized protein PtA15_15A155 [Puccinia triticina]WAQ91763.1 hypothetical protein PtA15_15A155 [Puccinia triticina]
MSMWPDYPNLTRIRHSQSPLPTRLLGHASRPGCILTFVCVLLHANTFVLTSDTAPRKLYALLSSSALHHPSPPRLQPKQPSSSAGSPSLTFLLTRLPKSCIKDGPDFNEPLASVAMLQLTTKLQCPPTRISGLMTRLSTPLSPAGHLQPSKPKVVRQAFGSSKDTAIAHCFTTTNSPSEKSCSPRCFSDAVPYTKSPPINPQR